jgi:hypothetical protein
VSGYAPLLRPLAEGALEISWQTAAYEFGLFGINIPELAAAGKRLIYRCVRLRLIVNVSQCTCAVFSFFGRGGGLSRVCLSGPPPPYLSQTRLPHPSPQPNPLQP